MRTKAQVLAAKRISDPYGWRKDIEDAIRATVNFTEASKVLGISRETMRAWCRELGIPKRKPRETTSKVA